MDIKSGHFGTPLEDLFFNNVARYQITNIPLETAGRTARLFAVPIDVTETVEETIAVGYGITYGLGYI